MISPSKIASPVRAALSTFMATPAFTSASAVSCGGSFAIVHEMRTPREWASDRGFCRRRAVFGDT